MSNFDEILSSRFYYASLDGVFETVDLLSLYSEVDLNFKPYGITTPFYAACSRGHKKIVDHFLKIQNRNVDYNFKSPKGCTAFTIACNQGRREVVEMLLLDERIEVDVPDNEGQTPLFHAVTNGHLKVVEMLLTSPRNINIYHRDKMMKTPIQHAKLRNRREMFKLMGQRARELFGADFSIMESLNAPGVVSSS